MALEWSSYNFFFRKIKDAGSGSGEVFEELLVQPHWAR